MVNSTILGMLQFLTKTHADYPIILNAVDEFI